MNDFIGNLGVCWGALVVLAVIVAVIAAMIKREEEDRRMEKIRKDPEAYRIYAEWEKEKQAKEAEALAKKKEVAAKVAVGGAKVAIWLLGTILKKK